MGTSLSREEAMFEALLKQKYLKKRKRKILTVIVRYAGLLFDS